MSASDLNVAIVQADTVWHDPPANRARYAERFAALGPGVDLVVLPETFTSGFSNEALERAETMAGETVAWLRAQSAEHGFAITGSVQIRDGDAVYNRMLWVQPDGSVRHYDKRHLFRMAGEHTRYAAGADRLVVEYKGWRICPLVCYDLRFPVFSRNRFGHSVPDACDYDLLIYVANWPSPRHFAWQTLLKARAIENLSYVIGVNRTGTDANNLHYLGGSAVLDFLGQPLAEADDTPQVRSARLSYAELSAFRQRFPAYLDADRFTLDD